MWLIMLEKFIILYYKYIKKLVVWVIDVYWMEYMYCRMYLFIENVIILVDDDKGFVVIVIVFEINLDCFYELFIVLI